jgi:hypothetical protein
VTTQRICHLTLGFRHEHKSSDAAGAVRKLAEIAIGSPDVAIDPGESEPKDEAAFLSGNAQNQRLP